MFLVVSHHEMDDIPVGIYFTLEEAKVNAQDMADMLKVCPMQTTLTSGQASTPVCVCVYEYRGGAFVRCIRYDVALEDQE